MICNFQNGYTGYEYQSEWNRGVEHTTPPPLKKKSQNQMFEERGGKRIFPVK